MTKEEEIHKILSYVCSQAQYCEKQSDNPKFSTETYCGKEGMTDEQMSGYYKGRAEANRALEYYIKITLRKKTNQNEKAQS
jgi:hypothetical protein